MTKKSKTTKVGASLTQRPHSKRDPMVMLICGGMGIGKTYRSKQEIKHYLKHRFDKGKKGRKILAFDVNGGDYTEFKTVNPKYMRQLSKISARRILPFNEDGTAMDQKQKRDMAHRILNTFTNGMVILDDTDSYMSGAKDQAIISALTTVRHKGLDLLLSHQSISKITATEWQACTWLRLHHQVDSVVKYKDRIPAYELVRISQLMINEQFNLCSDAFHRGELTEEEYNMKKSFFVYVNMRKLKVSGCSRAAYIRACKRFIDHEEGKRVRMYLNERNFNGKPVYKDRNAVIVQLISEYLRYHDSRIQSPV